jgi:SOS regulatory protein LexA
MLTAKQKQILDFILNFKEKFKRPPTLDEIAKNFNKSIPTIHFHIQTLRAKGFLKLPETKARSIDVFDPSDEIVEIPLLGYISAGEGIENLESPEPIKVQKNLLSPTGQHYALRVKGESMIDVGILDGDIVVIKYQHYADNGDIVVALIRNETLDIKATIKKFYNRGEKIELVPQSPKYKESIWVKPEDVEIRGKFVGLLRQP